MPVNTTYGFPYPISSEPVANGASNIQALAEAVNDKSGLIRLAGSTYANATTFDITGFSGLFSDYRLILRHRRIDAAGSGNLIAQCRVGSTPISTGYYQGSASFSYLGSIGSLFLRNNGTDFIFGTSDSFQTFSNYSYDITNVSTRGLTFSGSGYFTGAAYSLTNGGSVSTSSFIDHIRCVWSAGRHSGAWTLYGYGAI